MLLDYEKIVSFLFPLSEDEVVLKEVHVPDFLSLYAVRLHGDIQYLLPYSDARVRSAIHLSKFHNHKRAAFLLSSVLSAYLKKSNSECLYIPIPLSRERYRARGYNQVETVLRKALKRNPHIYYNKKVLMRERNTPPQTSLAKEERLHNLNDAFRIKDPSQVSGKDIILLDDVTTTGATLRAAKAALLLHSPASITCVALAH